MLFNNPVVKYSNALVWSGYSLIAPSLHALIENLPLVASASKGGLTLALRQVAVTIFVNLTLGGVAQS